MSIKSFLRGVFFVGVLALILGGTVVQAQVVPVTALVTVQVDDHSGTGIPGVQIRYGTSSPTSAYFGTQPSDGSGQATGPLTVGTTYVFQVDYHYGHAISAPLTVDANPANNIVQFQTILLTLRLEKCNSDPLDGGAVRYGPNAAFGTAFWPGGATGTSALGETEAEFFPGTYSFEMGFNGTTQVKSNVVIPNANTVLTWQTTAVTLGYDGTIKYGGASGTSSHFKSFVSPATHTMEMLPGGTHKFSFDGFGVKDLTLSNCTFKAAVVSLKLKNHNGSGLSGGTARGGYATPTSWHVSGSTDGSGILQEFRQGNTNLSYEMKYNGTIAVVGPKDASLDPVYNFQTREVTLRLENCSSTPLDGGHGRYGIGSNYGAWHFPGGNTGSSAPGETAAEMFPGTYSFEMGYNSTVSRKISVIIPDADTKLTWQTTTVQLHHQYPIAFGGPTGDDLNFANPTEMLPGSVMFNFRTTAPGVGHVRRSLSVSGCTYEKTVAVAQVVSGNNTGRPGFSGFWHENNPGSTTPWGSTNSSGYYLTIIDGLPSQPTTFCVNYWSNTDCLTQTAHTNSVYRFKPQNTLDISSTDHGSVTVPGESIYTYDAGATVNVAAVAEVNYHFVMWTGTAVDAGKVANPASANTSVTMHDDYTLIANFAIDRYDLATSSGAGGSVTTPGEGVYTYDLGTVVTVLAVPDPNRYFVKWTGTAVNAGKVTNPASASTSVAMHGDYTLVANFGITEYVLDVSSARGGTVTRPGLGPFKYRADWKVRLMAEADPLFTFSHWSWPGGVLSEGNPHEFYLDGYTRVKAHFVSLLDVLYVDANNPGDPNENGSEEHPFNGIQEAIDLAADGATIVVRAGTYQEIIVVEGKSLHLTSAEPNQPGVFAYPVLDGNGDGPVVELSGNSSLEGFVIQGGDAANESACAIYCAGADAYIAHCIAAGNSSSADDGAIVHCINSSVVIQNCTFADNTAGSQAACLVVENSNVTVESSILWNNTPDEILISSGSDPVISDSTVAGGFGGNLASDPLFAQPGDYHLQSEAGRWDPNGLVWVMDGVTSPSIDTGDPVVLVGVEPEPNGGRINQGAYGGTDQASKTPTP
ncbi:right-handed parallel beta-helix repeat-containing protein [Planctomycetota bacterium]